jgi:mRNA interferase MazF
MFPDRHLNRVVLNCVYRVDVVWLDFDPLKANEQAGRRPALVISDHAFNELTGRCAVCPITSTVRRWSFEVAVPNGVGVDGVILVDQLRVLSWRSRGSKHIGSVPVELLDDVRASNSRAFGEWTDTGLKNRATTHRVHPASKSEGGRVRTTTGSATDPEIFYAVS